VDELPTNSSRVSNPAAPESSNRTQDLEAIQIKIKKSDSQIVKVSVLVTRDTVRDLKEKVFHKEREEGKNVRLIYQGKVLQDSDSLEKYSKLVMIAMSV
jgi:hypothetical protein